MDDSLSSRYQVKGSGCVPVDAPVFKTGGRSRRASGCGFDSHPLPPILKIGRRLTQVDTDFLFVVVYALM
jgi:hypothetical protein